MNFTQNHEFQEQPNWDDPLRSIFKAEAKSNITRTEMRSADRRSRKCKSEGEKCDSDSAQVTWGGVGGCDSGYVKCSFCSGS